MKRKTALKNKRTPTKVINSLTKNFGPEERETDVMFDHSEKVVRFETTNANVAKKLKGMIKDSKVEFDENVDSFRITIPMEYCRTPELLIKSKHRPEK